ncbi:efflux RND transporter permease subunit [Candidatus Peregrinibacteria bacterium]|nr:efflux RND transporter permease subunit [Candidatus Peregrinibacteria bacterium]
MWNFFLKNYRFTYILILATLIIGLISTLSIPKESTPEVQIPVGIVSTFLNGANSEDIERLITNEIEEKISTLDELEKYTSVSAESISMITVEFDPKSDLDDRIRALKDAVDEAYPELPGEVEKPFTKQINFDDEPILIISLAASVHDIELKNIAEEVKRKLEKISGVSEVDIVGAYDRETQVVVDKAALELYDITIQQVLQAIQFQNSTLPGGTLEYDGIRYPVRFKGDIKNPVELPSIPISALNGSPIYLKDIAEITDSTKKPSSMARVSVNGSASNNAVSLHIKKKVGGDIVRTSKKIRSELAEMQKGILKDATLFISFDMAEYINEDLTRLMKSGMQTVIIVTILLILVLGVKAAILAGLSIPLSFLITIAGLSFIGSTINFLSLFSLVLALGILVDSAIVLTEGVHKKIEDGEEPFEAAANTIKQFKYPITSGVMTTIAAMIPMLFASGIIGEFIKHIPITVTLVLLSSLFVTMAFLPALAAKFLKKSTTQEPIYIENHSKTTCKRKFFTRFGEKYRDTLEHFLGNKRQKRILTTVLLLGFFGSLALPITGVLKVSMFPQGDSEMLFFDVETPISTALEETDKTIKKIEELLVTDARIESFTSNVGRPFSQDTMSPSLGETPNLAHIIVNLKDEKRSLKIVDEYQNSLKNLKGAKIRITQMDDGPPTGAPIAMKFKGEDLDELEQLTRRAEKLLKSINGAENIRSSVQDTELNFVLRLDRAKAMELGITPIEVAQLIRVAIHGIEATTIKQLEEDIDVLVKLNLNENNHLKNPHLTANATIDSIKSLKINTARGTIPLTSIVNITLEGGQGSVVHENGKRVAQTTAYTAKGVLAENIIKEVNKRESELQIPENYDLSFGGEREDIEESFADMFRALFIGIALIAGILVLQFNSFRQPIFVLMTVPLAITGILPGLAILRLPLSFTAFVGIVALAGIVVNNAILLIDRINENRRNSFEKLEAILEAASSRFRPILLTTVTTIAGITPLALSDITWGPLGASIIFGLAFSTILTLFVVPMLYLRFAEKEL